MFAGGSSCLLYFCQNNNMVLKTCFCLWNSYVLSFSLGAGPVPALLLPEIFASRIRAKAVALSLGMHWVREFLSDWFLLLLSILLYSVFHASFLIGKKKSCKNFILTTYKQKVYVFSEFRGWKRWHALVQYPTIEILRYFTSKELLNKEQVL